MSGTGIAYAAICLRRCYAMSSTDLEYAAVTYAKSVGAVTIWLFFQYRESNRQKAIQKVEEDRREY
eukprot:641669-Rhodomonas_salina.1